MSNCLATPSTECHSDQHPRMNIRLAILLAVVAVALASPSFADARTDAKAQVTFGINVAQRRGRVEVVSVK